MKTIALLTDFGLTDSYVATVKAVILSINSRVCLVDITHQVSKFNIEEAAFLLLGSFKFFPKGTIFLVVVDPGVGSSRYPIAIKTKNYYFVGPDNGVLSLAAQEDKIEKTVVLENRDYFLKNISSTFHARDIFAPVTAHLSKGLDINCLGRSIKAIKRIEIPKAKFLKDSIKAKIIYQDSFGNLITNLKKEELLKFLDGKDFVAILNRKKFYDIYNYYAEAKQSIPFFIEGSFGFLEISIKNNSASKYFNIKKKDNLKLIIKKK